MEKATLAGGCFWCTEAIFARVKGVSSVVSGYSGGDPPAGGENPDYESVASGSTGYAETIQIEFDPKEISYGKLLEIFFKLHDPTTLNSQGADIGEQYRSMIFYHSGKQKEIAKKIRGEIERKKIYDKPIVTEIVPLKNFYKAEDYHQNYYDNNREAAYCKTIIDPKIKKLMREFRDEARDSGA